MTYFGISLSDIDKQSSNSLDVQLKCPATPVVLNTLNRLLPPTNIHHPFFDPTNAHLKRFDRDLVCYLFKEHSIQHLNQILEVFIIGNLQNLEPEYQRRHDEVTDQKEKRKDVVYSALIQYKGEVLDEDEKIVLNCLDNVDSELLEEGIVFPLKKPKLARILFPVGEEGEFYANMDDILNHFNRYAMNGGILTAYSSESPVQAELQKPLTTNEVIEEIIFGLLQFPKPEAVEAKIRRQ